MTDTHDINRSHSRTYLILNEVCNAVTHGIGFGLSIAGLVVLIVVAAGTGEVLRVVSYAIYGTSLMMLYLASTLYHSLCFTRAMKVFKIIDHSCIYILIAGTYTPLSLVTIGGAMGWVLFGIIWGLAIAGIIYQSLFIGMYGKFSLGLYIAMGWFCILFIKPLYQGLGFDGFMLLLAGGLAFTIGALFYCLKVRFMHVVWHFFVMAGTILMYFSILYHA